MSLMQEWIDAKNTEQAAVERRRVIEDKLVEQFKLNQSIEGTQKAMADGFEVKAVGRINRSVNADLVQEIAAENGLMEHLSDLFRWKPEINLKAWQQADESITKPLSAAITAKPGRLSFSITKKED